jgi:hypothetical protein
MTVISQDQRAFSRSLPGGFAKESRLDPAWVTVALVSLFGLAVSWLVLASGVAADFEPVFLG